MFSQLTIQKADEVFSGQMREKLENLINNL
jgi:hypothetical protein